MPDSCFDIDMSDSYGDGWNDGYLSVYEGGAWVSDHATTGSNDVDQVCMSSSTFSMTVTYTSGSWESENSYSITGVTSGTVYLSDGPYPATGTVLALSSGGDSDDTDASVQ